MSKKALIIIAVLILLPIIVTLCLYIDHCQENPVVATYDGDVSRIKYNGKTLIAVEGEENYKFRYGEYLGKIGDTMFGASLYRVLDDNGKRYYAVPDRDKNILYTASGKLEDGVKNPNSKVTRLVFDDYAVVLEGEKAQTVSSAFMDDEAIVFTMKPSSYKDDEGKLQYRVYDIRESYDGSAILTKNTGKLYYLTEKKVWVFVPMETYNASVEEYGENSRKLTFEAYQLVDAAARLILSNYIEN